VYKKGIIKFKSFQNFQESPRMNTRKRRNEGEDLIKESSIFESSKKAACEDESKIEDSSERDFPTDEEILAKLPAPPSAIKFIRGKGIISPDENKLIQFCVLATVRFNWLLGGQYKTRTIVVEGRHVEEFYKFLKVHVEFKEPQGFDTMYLRCKFSDELIVLDRYKRELLYEEIERDDRVLVTFFVTHWVIPKKQQEDFQFKLLSIRSIPAEKFQAVEIYTGPEDL
jgi:hypothetical protein